MNKILNWTFGSVFRTIGRVFAYLLIGGLFALIMSKSGLKITDLFGIDTIYASTITISTPKNYNAYWYRCQNTSCSGTKTSNSTGAVDYGTSSSIGGQSYDFIYKVNNQFSYNYTSDKTYQIVFRIHLGGNQTGLDWIIDTNAFNRWTYQVDGYVDSTNGWQDNYIKSSACNVRFDTTTNNGFLVSCGVALNNNVSRIRVGVDFSKSIKDTLPGWKALKFTSVRVNLISASEYDGTQAIINNQTNILVDNNNKNTQDIIDNQTSISGSIIGSMNDIMGVKCSNLFNKNGNLKMGYSFGASGQDITLSNAFQSLEYYEVEPSSYITIGTHSNFVSTTDYRLQVIEYDANKQFIERRMDTSRSFTTFTMSSNTHYIRVGASDITLDELQVNKGSVFKPYCTYGSYSSKIDETTDAIDKTKDSIDSLHNDLLDDTINNSDINVNYNLQDNAYGPFGTFLNLPLTWVSNILASGQTCSTIKIPLPYLNNKTLDLPCMSGFWNSLGALGTLIQAFWLAVVGIKIFNGLFLLVVDTTSSKDNVDELTKLQTWEL